MGMSKVVRMENVYLVVLKARGDSKEMFTEEILANVALNTSVRVPWSIG